MHSPTPDDADSQGGVSLRSVIEDPLFTETVLWQWGRGRDVDSDGRVDYHFGPATEREVVVVRPEASPFEIEETGPDDEIRFAMVVMADSEITEEDRIRYQAAGTFQESVYRVAEPRPVTFAGDEFVWFKLLEDDRGEGTGSPEPTPPPDTGGGEGGTDDDDDLVR